MSTTVTLLVLLAALFHALWNAFVKKGHDPLVSIAGVALISGALSGIGIPFVSFPEAQMWPWIFVSIILHTFYMVMLSQAYRFGDFSLAYPIARGLAPALVVTFSLLAPWPALTTLRGSISYSTIFRATSKKIQTKR